jgi:hypothetical protein
MQVDADFIQPCWGWPGVAHARPVWFSCWGEAWKSTLSATFGWKEHGSIHRVGGESLNGSGRSTYERTGWIDDRESSAHRGGSARTMEASGSSDESELPLEPAPKP